MKLERGRHKPDWLRHIRCEIPPNLWDKCTIRYFTLPKSGRKTTLCFVEGLTLKTNSTSVVH